MKKDITSKKVIFIIIFIFLIFPYESYSEENIFPVLPEDQNNENIENASKGEQANKSKNINLDMQALYGFQYNQMFSAFNLSQERDTFVYLLSSKFNRSADFGYNGHTYVNSGFYENTAGLTVNWNLTDTKLIVEGEADNESRGMFDNNVYSREEEGNNKLLAKTIHKFSPSTEFFIAGGGAWYKHSLIAENAAKSRVLQGNAEAGIEYVWSASNRMRLNGYFLYYDYAPQEFENDRHSKVELIDDFNMTSNIAISLGLGYVYNKDGEGVRFPVPFTSSLSLKGYKYLNSVFIYKFDILPFRPEEFYLKQKYINPTYNLPPQAVHTGEVKVDSTPGSFLTLKGNFKVEKNNHFYNYFPIFGNVLSAETLEVISYNAGAEAVFSLYKKIWELSVNYNYFYYSADKNITYEPSHEASGSIRYNGKYWKLEWSNTFRGSVFIDPDSNEKLPEAFIGSLGIQRRILEGSYFYGKVENIYNNKYALRKGYPEPGISFLLGLRILI